MPPHNFHRARWPCGMPLWHLSSLQADHAPPPGDSGTFGSEPQQPPAQATLSPFVHLSKDLYLSFLKTKNQCLPSQAEMSCRFLTRREMPFLRPSIVPASVRLAPPFTDSQADLSRKQGVAMHRMRQENHPTVLRPSQFVVEPILRFSRKLPSFCVVKLYAFL